MNPKLLLLFALAISSAVSQLTTLKLNRTDRRMKRIRRILNRKGLMKCIFFHDLQRLPDSDCLVKYHLSHRYEQIISVLSKVVIDVVYKKHACLHLGRVPELKTCVRVVRLDLRRNFHLSLKTVEERIFFREIVNRFVRYISVVRHKIQRTVNVDINQALNFARPDAPKQYILDQGDAPELPQVDETDSQPEHFENEDQDEEERKRASDLKRFILMNQLRKEAADRLNNRPVSNNKYIYKYPPKFDINLNRTPVQEQPEEEETEPEETEQDEEPARRPLNIRIDQLPVQRRREINMNEFNQALAEKFNQQLKSNAWEKVPLKREQPAEEESISDEEKEEPVTQSVVNTRPVQPITAKNDKGEQVMSFDLKDLLGADGDKKQLGEQLANMFKNQGGQPIAETKPIVVKQELKEPPKEKETVAKEPEVKNDNEKPKGASITYTKIHHPHHSHTIYEPATIGKIVTSKPVTPETDTEAKVTDSLKEVPEKKPLKNSLVRREENSQPKQKSEKEHTTSDNSGSKTNSNTDKEPGARKKAAGDIITSSTNINKDSSPTTPKTEEKGSAENAVPKVETYGTATKETSGLKINKKMHKPVKEKKSEKDEDLKKLEQVKKENSPSEDKASVKTELKKNEEENSSSADDEDPNSENKRSSKKSAQQQTGEDLEEHDTKLAIPQEKGQGNSPQLVQDTSSGKKARKAHPNKIQSIHITVELPKAGSSITNISNHPNESKKENTKPVAPKETDKKEPAEVKTVEAKPKTDATAKKPAETVPAKITDEKTKAPAKVVNDVKKGATAAAVAKDQKTSPAKSQPKASSDGKTSKPADKNSKAATQSGKDAGKETQEAKDKAKLEESYCSSVIVKTVIGVILGAFLL
jgi:hypothetical protein